MRNTFLSLLVVMAATLHAQWIPPNPVVGIEQQPDGVLFKLESGALRLQVCTDSIVHVIYSPAEPFPKRTEYVVTKSTWPAAKWALQETPQAVTISTDHIRVAVNRSHAMIAYSDTSGKRLVQEGPNTLTPVTVNGEKTYHAEAFIGLWGSTEAFYGLGQHQSGVWNYHGESVDIAQDNTNISVPLLLSSKGYGIFWNNSSRSRCSTAIEIGR